MASAAKRRKTKKAAPAKRRAKARIKATAPDTGPVTLEEAKALALLKRPKLAARAVRATAAPPASPAAVGAERERLEKSGEKNSRAAFKNTRPRWKS
jgi:hypothetical protein